MNCGRIALFGGIRHVHFLCKVTPDDVLTIECTLTHQRGPADIGTCATKGSEETACTAKLIFAVEQEDGCFPAKLLYQRESLDRAEGPCCRMHFLVYAEFLRHPKGLRGKAVSLQSTQSMV